MAKQLNVLFLSSEVEPFAKTGGLADVSGALPQTIKHLDHEIRVMMPRYGSINERKSKLHDMIRLKDIPVRVGAKDFPASVKSSFLSSNHTKVQVYFLDNQALFGRSGLYVHPDSKKDYADNDERFIFFARGVLEVLKKMGWQPDIIHCNDWPTGLVPAYLKTVYRDDPFYKDTKTVFTIHNMAYQGAFPKTSFAKTSLPHELLSGIEEDGKMNFLKSGLVYADALTTVSEKYAEEIRSSQEFGYGLQETAEKRKKDLTGITNGIDYTVWNPAQDELIPHRYDSKTLELKKENKKALVEKLGLPFEEQVPVIGMISRLADQKGFDLLEIVMDDVMKMKVQMVLLGEGEKKYHVMFEKMARKYHKKFAIDLSFNPSLAHLIEAGSDMFLMPSRYEPCGLNQMYSMKYGTVPIARATGGLDDTIEDLKEGSSEGTGFKFKRYHADDLLKTIQRALRVYADEQRWRKIMRNGMGKDFSWEASARKYIQLYRTLARK